MTKITNIMKTPKPFDEAVTLTGYGIFHLYVLLATGGCLMCVIIETMSAMFIIPSSQCDLNLGLSEKGILYSVSFLGVVSSSYIWGYLADTKGRKNILVYCLVSSSILSLVCSIVPWTWLFIILRFLNGALVGGSSAIIYAFAGEFHDNSHRPRAVSLISTFVAVGNIYLPGMAWIVLSADWAYDVPALGIIFRPWRLLIIIYALPSLVVAFMLHLLPESPKYLLTQGKHDEALGILANIFRINKRNYPENYTVSHIIWDEMDGPKHEQKETIWSSMWKQTVPLFKGQYLIKTILVCYLQFGVFLSSSAMMMWYPEILNSMSQFSKNVSNGEVQLCQSIKYAETEENLDTNFKMSKADVCIDAIDKDVFVVSLVVGALYALAYMFIGFTINVFGKKNLLITFVTITGICGVCSEYVYGYSYVQVLTGIFLVVGAGIGVVNAMVVDLYPTQVRAMALALSLMFGRFGAMVGSNAIGPIFYNYCEYLFYLFAANHILMVICTVLLPGPPKNFQDNKEEPS